MHVTKKLVALSVAVLGMGTLAVSAPMSAQAAPTQTNNKMQTLDYVGNAAVDVNTEVNCTSHTLTAKVKNKLSTQISPDVTFNGVQQELYPQQVPIKPGQTGEYRYSYSGNNQSIKTKVSVDTYQPLEVAPTLNCSEPVTFTITSASKTGLSGILTNNSSLVSQDVVTQANNGQKRLEPLQPSEGREITLNYDSFPEAKSVYVSIGTTTGYQGNYLVDLSYPTTTPIPMPLPTPTKQN